jgi:hypothetical protein
MHGDQVKGENEIRTENGKPEERDSGFAVSLFRPGILCQTR